MSVASGGVFVLGQAPVWVHRQGVGLKEGVCGVQQLLVITQALPWGVTLAYIAAWGPGCLPSLEVRFVRSSGLGLCGGGGVCKGALGV